MMRTSLFAAFVALSLGPLTAAAESPSVKMITSMGEIVITLDADKAPKTVENFLTYVDTGFYDGTIFHRVISGFMIQGGCPDGNGMGGPGYGIKGEFNINGFKNDLKHSRGVISMARSMNPNSGGSQFFLMHKDSPHLDGQYAGYGSGSGYRVAHHPLQGQPARRKLALR